MKASDIKKAMHPDLYRRFEDWFNNAFPGRPELHDCTLEAYWFGLAGDTIK